MTAVGACVVWKQRLARTLTKRQKDEDSIRSRVRRSRSFARHHQDDVGADELSYEDWRPASSSYSDRTQPPYALGKLLRKFIRVPQCLQVSVLRCGCEAWIDGNNTWMTHVYYTAGLLHWVALFKGADFCYLRQWGHVLPVCLLATPRKTTDRIFMNILPKIYYLTRKIPLNFGNHQQPDRENWITSTSPHCLFSVVANGHTPCRCGLHRSRAIIS